MHKLPTYEENIITTKLTRPVSKRSVN